MIELFTQSPNKKILINLDIKIWKLETWAKVFVYFLRPPIFSDPILSNIRAEHTIILLQLIRSIALGSRARTFWTLESSFGKRCWTWHLRWRGRWRWRAYSSLLCILQLHPGGVCLDQWYRTKRGTHEVHQGAHQVRRQSKLCRPQRYATSWAPFRCSVCYAFSSESRNHNTDARICRAPLWRSVQG